MSTFVHSWEERGNKASQLAVIAKRSYRIHRGVCTPLGEAPPILREPLVSTSAEIKELVLPADTDAPKRPLTDVLVLGHAHSVHGAVRELTTGVQIGRAHKLVRVRGERTVHLGPGDAVAEGPSEGFVRMPLTWSYAYGGRDRHAEEVLRRDPDAPLWVQFGSFAYPRNRTGRGFVANLDRERLDGMLLPNLDDPADPVLPTRLLARDALDWADRPVAAGYGALDPLTFPRCMFSLIRPDWRDDAAPFRELAVGTLLQHDLADRPIQDPLDPRFFNCAPAGLAVCRLHGGERATLSNLHRDFDRWEFDLPRDRPRLIVEPPGCRAYELEPFLSMVLLEPDDDRVTLTWAGRMDVAAAFPEAMCKEMRHGAIWSR